MTYLVVYQYEGGIGSVYCKVKSEYPTIKEIMELQKGISEKYLSGKPAVITNYLRLGEEK